ncbi:MAG: carboxypeptidase-like regulatory domain-containing protein [Reichenbachiella sp.]
MKHFITNLLLCCFPALLSAQSIGNKITTQFSNIELNIALETLEDLSNTQFYYQSSWVDSVFVSGDFNNTPLNKVLTDLFEGTALSFFIEGFEVIITNNVIIDGSPKILTSFAPNEEISNSELGLVFVREYQNTNIDKDDKENFVQDIGSRTKMVVGGKSTLVGYLKSSEKNEPVVGGLVYVKDPFLATTTDENGFYSIALPNGRQTVFFQYAGLKTTQRKIVMFSNGSLNIDMDIDIIALQEVVIESGRDANIKDVQIGVNKINIEETKTVPLVLGEKDIMKIATTMAGVQTVGEGAAGYNVRGGKADQNLILVNGAPVYNPSHFLGFFSAFNADAIDNMEVYKGSIPAKHGGRLSSVFDIQGKSGNKEKISGTGGISPVTLRFMMEAPIIQDSLSVIAGVRYTYSDWVLKLVENANFNGNQVDFMDLIAQVDYLIDDKNALTVSGYYSKDKFRLSSDTLFSFSDFSYVNANASVKWKRKINNNLDAAFTALGAHYSYEMLYDQSPPNSFTQDFGLNEYTIATDFNYYPTEEQRINFGFSTKNYRVNPGSMSPKGSESTVLYDEVQNEQGQESALYISDQIEINPELTIYGGIRYSMFNALGAQDVYGYADGLPKNRDSRIDTTSYSKGEIIKTYHGPEFRVFGRYALDVNSSVKLSYNRTRQYIHTMSNSTSLSPTDVWRLSSAHIKPQIADQIALGYYRNFYNNEWELSVETYYKFLQDLIDFKVGGTFLLNPAIETEVLQGKGKSYGIEFSLKKSGRLNGWVNYTYARTFIQLDGGNPEETINAGQFYPTNYDKPHTFNMVANYKFTRRLSASTNVSFSSGRPVTYPVAVYDFQGAQNLHYSDRNAFRIPDYFRIDLGINLEGNHKIKKLAHSFWTLSVYNLLGRSNPYSVFFDVENGTVNGYQLVIFGEPIPTLTYNFKF